jgi:large subunit ribosomal protein L13e
MNVDRLNSYKEKLILFPRREAKPKKGLIADSQAAALESVAAKTQTAGNFARPAVSTEPVFEAIAQADKDHRVYNHLRTLRTVKHYKGRRDARAKAEEEKKK